MDSRSIRQQIYDKIRETSKDEYVLQEMKRLGFWKKNENQPELSEQLIKQEGELQRTLNELLAEKNKYADKEQLLREIRQQRMKASKEKREQTRAKKEQLRIEKAAQWQISKEKDILFLGEDVSGGLNNTENNAAQLSQFNLPGFNDVASLAAAIGITISDLKFLSYYRKVSTTSHYKRFSLPKKSGGYRTISAPMPRLKSLQHWILNNILIKIPTHHAANGFVANRSIMTNANNHIGKKTVVNVDLKNFFPTVNYKRVKGVFSTLGYSEQIATILALLCTEPERDEMELDGKTYHVANGERFLPQGAPTSPAITNIICYKLDVRLEGVARQLEFSYTRYADDLSFSTNETGSEDKNLVQQLLWRVEKVVKEEGFTVHPDKVKVMGQGTRQEVTGIVVNKKPGINRQTLHRFRALIHQINQSGIEGKVWKGNNHIVSEMVGYANFIIQVKPEQGTKLKTALLQAFKKHNIQTEIFSSPPKFTKQSESKNNDRPPAENKDWWNVL
ncbi:reverse transcriptase family protein [Polluticaenibacter yanchengensis]|uniref:RNA-directed DNA polymerase n=1 Tax=Polluticaenibacter yanchengensis TaxID=3014562 RepID=A0ABT4ULW3_9BACT|nr:reverse transcriptase domain-containing protein [Chitinophagaceae bacterium LY-5]